MKISELDLLRNENELLYRRIKDLEGRLNEAVQIYNLRYLAEERDTYEIKSYHTDPKPKKKSWLRSPV